MHERYDIYQEKHVDCDGYYCCDKSHSPGIHDSKVVTIYTVPHTEPLHSGLREGVKQTYMCFLGTIQDMTLAEGSFQAY